MQDYFFDLFEYNHHYNQKLWELFHHHLDQVSDKPLRLFNHTMNAHHIWNSRISLVTPRFGVWEMHDFHELKNIDDVNFQQSKTMLKSVDLDKVIEYRTSTGDKFRNQVLHICFHIINHSTYHRGQIASEFRNQGLDPLVSDYIFYKR